MPCPCRGEEKKYAKEVTICKTTNRASTSRAAYSMVFFHSEHLYRRTLKYESRSIDAENEKEIRYIGANLNITYLKNSGILSPSNL